MWLPTLLTLKKAVVPLSVSLFRRLSITLYIKLAHHAVTASCPEKEKALCTGSCYLAHGQLLTELLTLKGFSPALPPGAKGLVPAPGAKGFCPAAPPGGVWQWRHAALWAR